MILENTSDPFSDENRPPSEVLPNYTLVETRSPTTLTSGPRAILRAGGGSRPPEYVPARPTVPLIYTFTMWHAESVLLIPPRSCPDRTPIYNIRVKLNLNPFTPLSYVTTIRRGATEDGSIVGEFEIGVSHPRAIVTFGNYSTRMSSILTKRSNEERVWRWKHTNIDLRWDCKSVLDDGSSMCVCYDSRKHQVASFVPPPPNASPPLPEATLTVFPDGHDMFDDILISALVIERKLTS
ncbi:hypothetical protein ABKN59_011532 [Abortiporus biennis]